MTPLKPPTADEALVGQQALAVEQLKELVEKNHLSDYRGMAEELLVNHDAIDLVAAALKSLTKEPDDTPVKITEERPLPMRRSGGNGHGRSGNRGGYRGNRGSNNRGERGGERGGRRGDRNNRRDGSSSRRDGGRRDGGRRQPRRSED
jgi:ATP-dependent RNA helicase DeaD